MGRRTARRRRDDDTRFLQRDAASSSQLLQLVAGGAPLAECLERMTLAQEGLFSDSLAAVLLVVNDGKQLSFAAGKRVPAEMRSALDGMSLGDDATPCGVAANEGRVVIARDLARDERWVMCREQAHEFQVRACWSVPFLSSRGHVLGTLDLYHRAPRAPNAEQLASLQRLASLASLAVERSRANDAIHQSEARLRKVFEHTPMGIYMRDGQGRLVYENPTLENLFHPYNAQVKEAWQRFVHPDDRAQTAAIMEGLVAGRADKTEQTVRMVFAANDTRVIHVRSSAIRHEGKLEGIVGTVEDVTARSQLEAQLAQAQKMEMVGQLAGGIAHDFNNLLTVILNALELLEQGAPPAQRELITHALDASERAAELTMQLLTFSRKQPLELRPFDVYEIVTGQCTMLRRLLGEQVSLQSECDGVGALVELDANLFGQLLMNLVVNARDAMPVGGTIQIRVETVIASQPEASSGSKTFVRVSVSDSGTGIPPEHMSRIFEPFFTTKEQGKGTGLGLAMVYSIAAQHNGFIEVETELGQGTTFHVYLPRSNNSVMATSGPRMSAPLFGSEGILLVEDELAVRQMVSASLAHCGYRVFASASGDDALEVWKAHSREIALLVTDVVMPGRLSGPALVRRLRTERPDLRVTFMSGYGTHNLENDALSVLVRKPFQLLTLASVVRKLLDQSPPALEEDPADSNQAG